MYYVTTRQRVRLTIDEALVTRTVAQITQARSVVAGGRIPAPLIDSPKCPRCSLVGICLPDETNRCSEGGEPRLKFVQLKLFDADDPAGAAVDESPAADGPVRRLVPARDDLRPLYLNSPGLYVGKSGQVLTVKDKQTEVQQVRINEICQLNLFGNIQLTTQAIQALCEAEVPIAYFSMGGWFYGITQGLGVKNIFLRREQFRLADVPGFCLRFSRALVSGKIRNQRTLLQRNHVEPPAVALAQMKCLQEDALHAESMEQLLGIEGNAARVYFEGFPGMLKVDDAQDDLPSAAACPSGVPEAAPTARGCCGWAGRVQRHAGTDVLRFSHQESPAAAGSGERAVVARLQRVGQGSDDHQPGRRL